MNVPAGHPRINANLQDPCGVPAHRLRALLDKAQDVKDVLAIEKEESQSFTNLVADLVHRNREKGKERV